jgi:hypothetical protein
MSLICLNVYVVFQMIFYNLLLMLYNTPYNGHIVFYIYHYLLFVIGNNENKKHNQLLFLFH